MRSPKKYFKQTIDDEITLKSNQLSSLIELYDEDEVIKLLIGYVLYELDEFEVDSIDSIKIALNYMLNIIQTRNVNRGIASKGTKSILTFNSSNNFSFSFFLFVIILYI